MKERLFIIDGTALAYRSHFAFIKNPLINSKGQHTSALYGVINSFIKIFQDHQPQYIAITFDRKEKTFRHEISTDYKANRPPMPDDLVSQLNAINEFFSLAGIKEISVAGYEADDIIGSLAKKFENNFDIVIVSGDKDFAQLVNDNICLYDPKNNTFIKEKEIIEKYEITPAQFIDYLALMGDASDNIPGAKGIGPKTAVKWLKEFGSIDTIYENIDKKPNSGEKEKLLASKDDVYLSRILATIKTDVPLNDIDQNRITFKIENLSNTIEFLNSYELRNLASIIQKKAPVQPQVETKLALSKPAGDTESTPTNTQLSTPLSQHSNKPVQLSLFMSEENTKLSTLNSQHSTPNSSPFTIISTLDQLKSILSEHSSEFFALEVETTSSNFIDAELIGLSLCLSENTAYYIPIKHSFAENLDTKQTLDLLHNFIERKIVIGHNIKFLVQILEKYGFIFENIIHYFIQIFDTMLAAYILDPGNYKYSLNDCAKRELDYEMTSAKVLLGTGKNQISLNMIDLQKACEYSAEKALVIYKLYKIYDSRLKNNNLDELFYNIEIPLVFVLSNMEKHGVNIDVTFLKNLDNQITEQINTLTNQIHLIAGETFNINSPQQLSVILFDKMKIPPVKKTQTGQSTDIDVLETLAEKHEIAKYLIEYRHLSKLKNTYIEALPQLVNHSTGRVHSSFNQTVTSTGRLSSSNPNMQNIPVRTPLGQEIRKAFTASEGKLIVSADYSQIELRLLALFSEDETMMKAFQNKQDIHTSTAAMIFKKDEYQVTKSERTKAKSINFGIMYGMGAKSLAKDIGLTTKEAQEFIDNYFANFPTIKAYIDKQKFNAHQNGYVETLFNRRLYLTDINSSNARLKSEAERVSVNMPIQGTAADIIKIAMVSIYQRIKYRDDIKMLIQVHDELVFEIDEDKLNELAVLINSEMENALDREYRKKVPIVVDIEYGKNWGEMT